MINKGYKFSDIHNLLISNNFKKIYKVRMRFRKSLSISMRIKYNNPKVSVIIVNYNNAKYLNNCISSVLNQSYKNKEIIVVDDRSKDNSLEVLKKFKKKL